MLIIISVTLIIISVFLIFYSYNSLKHTHLINKKVDRKNKELEKEYNELTKAVEFKRKNIDALENNLIDKQNQLDNIQKNISQTIENQQELSKKAFQNYCEILEKQYKEQEEEYDMYKDALETSYSNLQLQLMQDAETARRELAQIEATRAAAIQAQLKEKEIEENSSFYCLQITESELRDISILESVKSKLNQPRILSMLIWQTYWRTPMNQLCSNVIGRIDKTGIYKITNTKTKECYVGQAISITDRWKQHAKAGLGIDTPAGNKLYKAMQEYGIWNFSWEVLEECEQKELNDKEAYYIKLYQSKEYGYNSSKGINK